MKFVDWKQFSPTNNRFNSGVDDSISVSVSFDMIEWVSLGTGDVLRSIEYIDKTHDTLVRTTNSKPNECKLKISHQWTFYFGFFSSLFKYLEIKKISTIIITIIIITTRRRKEEKKQQGWVRNGLIGQWRRTTTYCRRSAVVVNGGKWWWWRRRRI